MNTVEQRKDAMIALRRRGIAIPNAVLSAVEKDVPGSELRRWPFWAAIWSRPQATEWRYNEAELVSAQSAWDTSKRHVDNQAELAADIDARKQQQRDERNKADASRKASELETVTAELRSAYLSQPGTTEEMFEKALPELLEARARQAALAGKSSRPVLPAHLYS